MSSTLPTDESLDLLSRRLHDSHAELAAVWLERLRALLPVDANSVFPTKSLLDHIPELIASIAAYVRAPQDQEIAANTGVIAKAAELGELRYEQRASVHQLLREYQILGEVLETFVIDEVARAGSSIDAVSALRALQSVMQAVRVLQQQTIDTFIGRYTETIERQTTELRGFTRLVSHEIRQPLGVLQVLARAWPDAGPAQQRRLAETLGRNVARMGDVAAKLERLARVSRVRDDSPAEQLIDLSGLVGEVVRQLQDMADARDVRVVVSDNLPALIGDAGRVELVFVNLIANAIKYADPNKPSRIVVIEPVEGAVTVAVRDNGIGIPADRLTAIFDQFVRVHAERDDELRAQGLGLGLAIVRESIEATGGAIAVESREGEGTTFTLTWPRPSAT